MSADDSDPLLSVAGQISSGVPVDWKAFEAHIATADQAAIAEELWSLERFARANEHLPAQWGRFQIIGQIGVGTFGVVYRAFDPSLQVEVALKVTRFRHPDRPGDLDRALEEGRRVVKVHHANVVRVFGVERIDDEIGLSMELVKGQSLNDIVRHAAPFSANEATIIAIDLCRALAAVHAAGVLHGDIKAQNVMREQGGRTVLMDFGTSRDLKRTPIADGADFAGTPLYLAPEVFAGSARTTASEIYSMGVLLYFLVTGSYPVEGDSRTAIGRLHEQRGVKKPLRDVRPDLPDAFITVVERALAETPKERYATAGALEAALVKVLPSLEREQREPVPPPSPTLKILLALVALLVLAVGSVTVYRLVGFSIGRLDTSRPNGVNSTAAAPLAGAGGGVSVAAADYQIEAAFYKEHPGGAVERLESGTTVAQDDALSLQVQVSIPAYVYVVSEDERGEAYLLFPLPGFAVSNPLQPGLRHRLPGTLNREAVSWQVTSAGQKEHFLLVASPEPSARFAEMFASLPQPTFGALEISRRLSNEELDVIKSLGKMSSDADFKNQLRGIGGLTASPATADRQLRLLPEFSTPLSGGEEHVQGVWIRQATFGNLSK